MKYKLIYKSSNKHALFLYRSYLNELNTQNFFSTFSFNTLPTTRKRVTLYKSAHVYKKAKEQFECRTFSFAVTVVGAEVVLKSFLLNCPKDLHLTITTTFSDL